MLSEISERTERDGAGSERSANAERERFKPCAERAPAPPRGERGENSENIYKLPLTPQTLTSCFFGGILKVGILVLFLLHNYPLNHFRKTASTRGFCYQLTF